MQLLMLVYTDPTADPVTDPPEGEGWIERWVAENDAAGRRVVGERVLSMEQARVVRVRRGGTLVTDGPFAETAEQLAGFDLLDCADMDEAVRVAADHPMAWYGRLELWPLGEVDPAELARARTRGATAGTAAEG